MGFRSGRCKAGAFATAFVTVSVRDRQPAGSGHPFHGFEGVKQYPVLSLGLQERAVMRYGRWFLLLAVAVSFAAPARSIPLPGSTGPAVGKKAPDFTLRETRIVRWRNLTENYKVRVRGQQVIEELDRLGR